MLYALSIRRHIGLVTTLDVTSGFHQIPIAEDDKKTTPFNTPAGYYELIAWFGYLDDIIIYNALLDKHICIYIKGSLERQRINNLKSQPNKYEEICV